MRNLFHEFVDYWIAAWLVLAGAGGFMPACDGAEPVSPETRATIVKLNQQIDEWFKGVSFRSEYTCRTGHSQSKADALQGKFSLLGQVMRGVFHKEHTDKLRISRTYGSPVKFAKLRSSARGPGAVNSDEIYVDKFMLSYIPAQKTIVGTCSIQQTRQQVKYGILGAGPYSAFTLGPLTCMGQRFKILKQFDDPDTVSGSLTSCSIEQIENERMLITMESDYGERSKTVILQVWTKPKHPVIEQCTVHSEFGDHKSVEVVIMAADFVDCDGYLVPRLVRSVMRQSEVLIPNELYSLQEWKSADLGQRKPTRDDFVMTVPSEGVKILGMKHRLPVKNGEYRIDLSRISKDDLHSSNRREF